MQTFTITGDLEQKLSKAAAYQGKTIGQVLTDLIFEYLDDMEDARLAESALQRIESGESTLVDWQDAKKQLHELGH